MDLNVMIKSRQSLQPPGGVATNVTLKDTRPKSGTEAQEAGHPNLPSNPPDEALRESRPNWERLGENLRPGAGGLCDTGAQARKPADMGHLQRQTRCASRMSDTPKITAVSLAPRCYKGGERENDSIWNITALV